MTCYRDSKHLNCSESFYKDQVFATLSSQTDEDNAEGRRSMEEILARLHAVESEPSENLGKELYLGHPIAVSV